jgi:hypothetical protein
MTLRSGSSYRNPYLFNFRNMIDRSTLKCTATPAAEPCTRSACLSRSLSRSAIMSFNDLSAFSLGAISMLGGMAAQSILKNPWFFRSFFHRDIWRVRLCRPPFLLAAGRLRRYLPGSRRDPGDCASGRVARIRIIRVRSTRGITVYSPGKSLPHGQAGLELLIFYIPLAQCARTNSHPCHPPNQNQS